MKPSEIVDKLVDRIYREYPEELPIKPSVVSLMIKNWLLDNDISIHENKQTSKDV